MTARDARVAGRHGCPSFTGRVDSGFGKFFMQAEKTWNIGPDISLEILPPYLALISSSSSTPSSRSSSSSLWNWIGEGRGFFSLR